MRVVTCPSGLIVILHRGSHSAATQLRVNPLCGPSFLQSASGTWGDFLGANSCAPIASHSPWGCIYLSLVSCTWFSPGHSHGSYLSQGLPAVAWILHESGLPSTGTRTYGLEATFLCYCSELRLNLAMPSLGRCLSRAMPLLGDASLGRCLSWAMSL